MHPGQTAEIYKNGECIGVAGALHPRLYSALDVNGPIYLFELCLNKLVKGSVARFTDISKMPEVRRDLAIVVKEEVAFGDVSEVIVKEAGEWLVDLTLFDIYKGKGVEPGNKSLAMGVTWQHPQKTLQDEEITGIFSKIVESLEQKFGAKLRS